MATKGQITQASNSTGKWLRGKQKLHVQMVENSIKELQKGILDSLTELKTAKGGKIEALNLNLTHMQKIQRKVEGLYATKFGDSTRRIIEDFKTTKSQLIGNFKVVGEAARFTDIDDVMMKTLRDGSYQQYLNLAGTSKNQVTQAMYNQVIAGGQFSDLVNEINGALVGTVAKGIVGMSLAQYSRLYARDMIMNYHNDVMMQKANDLGMDLFMYIGTLMSGSRDFCVRRVGNSYTKKEINSWKFKWRGKSGPALTHRGGYNCRHHWQPVRKEWLSDNDQSMIDKLWKLDKKGNIIKPVPVKRKPVPVKRKPVPVKRKPVPKEVGKNIIPMAPTALSIEKDLQKLRKTKEYKDIKNEIKLQVKKVEKIRKKREKIAPNLVKNPDSTSLYNSYSNISRELGTTTFRYNSLQRDLRKMESNLVIQKIKPPVGGKLKVNVVGIDSITEKKLNKGLNKLEEMLHPDVIKKMPRQKIEIQKGIRANYSTSRGSNGGLQLSNTNVATLVHEYGHGLESGMDDYLNQALLFRKRRVGNEKLSIIYKGTEEMGWKDEFFDHYCGKSYGGFLDYGNTEIISMGLEQMVRKPYTFFKQDPDYFNFILKVMWGDLK